MKALAIALLVLWAAPARADEAAARKHFFAGERAYKAQNFGAAAEHFEAAYKELALPEIAFSAAQAHRRHYRSEPTLERARRAVELYGVYLSKVKKGGKVGAAADYIGEMQREVDKLVAAGAGTKQKELTVERTRLGVSPVLSAERRDGALTEIADLPDPTDAKLVTLIDGKPVTPFEMIDVEPGPHTVRVEADGFLPHESTERVVKGQSAVAEIVMKPRPAVVTVKTEGGARIRVDGRAAAGTSLELPAGKHVVTILKRGREPVSREIDVARGQQLAIDAPLAKTGRRRAVPFIAAGAIVAATLSLAGATYAVVQHGRASDQLDAIRLGDQRPEAADRYDDLIARRDEATTGALITGGAALVFGGAALALYFLDQPSEENIRVTPTAGGLSVSGRF